MTSKEFKRTDNLFSLCGLNCNLCPMYIRKQCGGCFSDSPFYLTCPIAPCSVEYGVWNTALNVGNILVTNMNELTCTIL